MDYHQAKEISEEPNSEQRESPGCSFPELIPVRNGCHSILRGEGDGWFNKAFLFTCMQLCSATLSSFRQAGGAAAENNAQYCEIVRTMRLVQRAWLEVGATTTIRGEH